MRKQLRIALPAFQRAAVEEGDRILRRRGRLRVEAAEEEHEREEEWSYGHVGEMGA